MNEAQWEIRRAAAAAGLAGLDGKLIRGIPIVFNQRSQDLGGFFEVIAPEAVDRTIREAIDVRALVDHDPAKVLGRLTAGTLTLKKETGGLSTKIDPPNTTAARDILESIGRGDVTGMSFAFQTLTDDWHMEDGETIRTIFDMRVREISIVSFPAYTGTDVAVALRALERFKTEGRRPSPDLERRRLIATRRV